MVGSEGTLGIVTEITLKLLPRPRYVATALVVFRVGGGRRARGEQVLQRASSRAAWS